MDKQRIMDLLVPVRTIEIEFRCECNREIAEKVARELLEKKYADIGDDFDKINIDSLFSIPAFAVPRVRELQEKNACKCLEDGEPA